MLILKSLEKKKKNKKVTKTKYYLKRRATLALKKQYIRLCKELFLCESITLLSSLKKIIGYFSGNEKYSGSHYGKSLQFLTAPSHCLGRVNKENEMFLGRDCQNPNILVISYNISKIQKILARFFGEIAIWSFFLIKLHVTERLGSLNEVYEWVAGLKNHTNKCCWP